MTHEQRAAPFLLLAFRSCVTTERSPYMLHLTSWTQTLPMMASGMLGIILVMGVIVLVVMLLNKLTSRK